MFRTEGQALNFIRRSRIAKGTVVNTDESANRNALHSQFEMKRINQGEAYSLDGWGHECVRYACHGCGYSWTERAPEQECQGGVALLPARRRPRSDVLASKPDQRIPIGSAKYRIAG